MFVIKFPAPGVMEVTPLNLSDLFHLKEKEAQETQEQKNEKGGTEDADICAQS